MTYSNPTYTNNVSSPHQGSIVGLMTPTGTVVEEYAYDAWGKRRNPNSWCYDNTLTPSTYKIDRGYTGHEHLDEFGLINMNGRLYDPLLGRMLSPDNFIQAPYATQSYNRFSYCLNNPLLYIDPTGEEMRYIYSLPQPNRALGSGLDGDDQLAIAEEWERYIESAYTQYFLDDITSTGGLLPEAIVLAKSTTKKKPSRQIEFDDSWSKGLSAFDNIATISGLLVDGAQFGWNSMSNGQQWKYSYKASKYLKEKGKNVQPRVIKHGANGVLKNASRKITYVGGVIAVADIAIDGELC